MSWLAAARSELGAERILDAAAELFAAEGVGRPGMEDIARAAGCSRATVYRYFDTKQALLRAFVHREAREITGQVARDLEQRGASADVAEAVIATLAAVRGRTYLEPWYRGEATDLFEVFRESPVVTGEPDPERGRWLLRIVMSFLREPGESAEEERRLVERFVVPVLSR